MTTEDVPYTFLSEPPNTGSFLMVWTYNCSVWSYDCRINSGGEVEYYIEEDDCYAVDPDLPDSVQDVVYLVSSV